MSRIIFFLSAVFLFPSLALAGTKLNCDVYDASKIYKDSNGKLSVKMEMNLKVDYDLETSNVQFVDSVYKQVENGFVFDDDGDLTQLNLSSGDLISFLYITKKDHVRTVLDLLDRDDNNMRDNQKYLDYINKLFIDNGIDINSVLQLTYDVALPQVGRVEKRNSFFFLACMEYKLNY